MGRIQTGHTDLFPCRIVEGCGEGAGFCDCTCFNKYIDWIQGSYSSLSVFGGLLAIDLQTAQKIVPFGGFLYL